MVQKNFAGDIVRIQTDRHPLNNRIGKIVGTQKFFKQTDRNGRFLEDGHIFDFELISAFNWYVPMIYNEKKERIILKNKNGQVDIYKLHHFSYGVEITELFKVSGLTFGEIVILEDGDFVKLGNIFQHADLLVPTWKDKLICHLRSFRLRLTGGDHFTHLLSEIKNGMYRVAEKMKSEKLFAELYYQDSETK